MGQFKFLNPAYFKEWVKPHKCDFAPNSSTGKDMFRDVSFLLLKQWVFDIVCVSFTTLVTEQQSIEAEENQQWE